MFKTSRRLLLVLSAGLLALSPLRGQEVIYIASGSGGIAGNLYTVDPTTAVTTLVGPITNASGGGAIGITGLAFHPLNGKLYGITSNATSGNTVQRSLVTINTTTAVATVIGGLGFPNSDISFRSDGTLYGYEAGGNTPAARSMTTINLTTGAATRVGTAFASSVTFGGGLAFSPSGTLYLSASGSAGSLDTLDPSTGARTSGPPTTGAPFPDGAFTAMACSANGTLFAINQSSDSDPPDFNNYLVTIEPIAGGVTQVGPTPSNLPTSIDAMAFDPGTSKRFKMISKVGSTATMTIDSLSGYTYQLQRSATGLPGTFTNIGSSQNGTGGTLTFTDPTATSPAAFYRVSIGHIPGANPGPLKPDRHRANLTR
jgi:hypothetical protein